MLYLVILMLVILAVAGAVVLYAAFPHRGEEVPGAPWIGDAMSRAVEALPTVEPEETVDNQEAQEQGTGLHR